MSQTHAPLRAVSVGLKIFVLVLTLAYIGEKSLELKHITWVIGDAGRNVALVFAFWLATLPQGFCLVASWAAANVLDRIGRGDGFGRSVVKCLREVGLNLILSGLAGIVLVPFLKPILEGRAWAVGVTFDIQSVTIGTIGLVLFLVAQQGRAIKAELEQFV